MKMISILTKRLVSLKDVRCLNRVVLHRPYKVNRIRSMVPNASRFFRLRYSTSLIAATTVSAMAGTIIIKTDPQSPESHQSTQTRLKMNNKGDPTTNGMNSTSNISSINTTPDGAFGSGGKDTQTIVNQLWSQVTNEKLFQKLFDDQHWEVAQIWSQLSHRIDCSYPDPFDTIDGKEGLKPLDILTSKNLKLLSNATYAMRHSLCAYPNIYLSVLLGDIKYAMKPSETYTISQVFNIDEKRDIIKCSLIPSIYVHKPSYYLCVDHNANKIVLSIRGSSTPADILTDVNFESKQFTVGAAGIDTNNDGDGNNNSKKIGFFRSLFRKKEIPPPTGHAHDGMLASARWIYEETKDELREVCKKYPTYQCIFTGHSLGAGCASLLGLLYKDDPIVYKQNRLNVFSFASPCVVSKDIADIGNDYIYSFTLGTDIVTRLSLQSVLHMYKRFDLIYGVLSKKGVKNKSRTEAYLKEKENGNLNEKEIASLNEVKENLAKFGDCQDLIPRCMAHLNDDDDGGDHGQGDEDDAFGFLLALKEMKPVIEQDQLFPAGRLLWFVPDVALEKNREKRKRLLMGLDEKNKNQDKYDIDFNGAIEKLTQTFYPLFGWQYESNGDESKGEQTKTQLMEKQKEMNINKNKNKKEKGLDEEYHSDYITTRANLSRFKNYVLCDATQHRVIFQELVCEFYDSFFSHLPTRYMEVLNATLIE